MKTLMLFPFPHLLYHLHLPYHHLPHPLTSSPSHLLTSSPPHPLTSSPPLTSPPHPLTLSLPHLPHPLTSSPPHLPTPSQSGVTKEHAAANGQCGHTSTRLVPSPWLREEPGQTTAGETAVHSKKGKTRPLCTQSSVYRLWWSPTFFQKEENARRQARGDPPLPVSEEVVEQELNLRPVNPPPRLEALLLGKQVDLRCHEITEIAGGTFAKLYLSEGLQPK